MTPASQFAASQGIPEAQITHCVRIGRRKGWNLDVYAVGWWGEYAYHAAIAEHNGERWGEMRHTSDRDVERLEVER